MLDGTFDKINGADKIGNKAIGWCVIKFHRCADLLDHALIHHGNAITGGQRFLLIMSDENSRDAEAALKGLQFLAHLYSQLGIKVG